MAGTRVVIAKYLCFLKVNPEVVMRIIDLLVKQSGYPSINTVTEFMEECGIKCETITCENRFERFLNINELCLAQVLNEDISLVLVISADGENITYIDGIGRIIKEQYNSFKWTNKIIKLSIDNTESIVARINYLKELQRKKAVLLPTIENIKSVSMLREAPIYRLCRKVSIYFSYLFIKLKVHPNWITFLWFVCIVIAAYFFSEGESILFSITGAFFILLGYIFDCSDGEVARMTQKYSRIGGYLDTIIHSISSLIIILGVTCGINKSSNENSIMKTGLVCLFGGAIFNYLFGQLNYWRNKNRSYGIFHPLLTPLFWLFPIDLNFFLIGGIFNILSTTLKIWAMVSFILSTIMCVIFFSQEYLYARRDK